VPKRIGNFGVFKGEFYNFAIPLFNAHVFKAFAASQVVGQGHCFDVALDAMRTHELADGDVFLRIGHELVELRA